MADCIPSSKPCFHLDLHRSAGPVYHCMSCLQAFAVPAADRAADEPRAEHPKAMQDVVDFWQDAANDYVNREHADLVSSVLRDVRRAAQPPTGDQRIVEAAKAVAAVYKTGGVSAMVATVEALIAEVDRCALTKKEPTVEGALGELRQRLGLPVEKTAKQCICTTINAPQAVGMHVHSDCPLHGYLISRNDSGT